MGLLKNKNLRNTVKNFLASYPELRDDDFRLMANVWKTEVPYTEMSAEDLLRALAKGELAHFESIRRCRQKLQELHPVLRGERWTKRHIKLEPETRKEIKSFI